MTQFAPTDAPLIDEGVLFKAAVIFNYSPRQYALLQDKDNNWGQDSACQNDPVFWMDAPKEDGKLRRQINEHCKAVCRDCPVLYPCRNYAIEFPEPDGVWGGMTWYERKEFRKARR